MVAFFELDKKVTPYFNAMQYFLTKHEEVAVKLLTEMTKQHLFRDALIILRKFRRELK
jgi:hypothetical protein